MSDIKNICILGSTGSIGKSSLEVIANFPEKFRVRYLTANTNIRLLYGQIRRFRPEAVAVSDEASARKLRDLLDGSLDVLSGENGLNDLAGREETDIVINSLVGFAGLRPTLEAVKKGKKIALANKETLVAAGEIVTKLVKKHRAQLVPVDSEHSAILQCLTGENPDSVSRLILTASGGPFLDLEKKHFKSVTVRSALRHPKWKMGNKITIDSATLMNKGLEVIEAHWFFGLPPEKITVLIHPQSIVHSMVEFSDGSVKAQLGFPSMKIPIQYALTHPLREISGCQRVNFIKLGKLTFLKPDLKKFECLQLAYDALNAGGTAPAVLNAANEVAVDSFLKGKIRFDRIPELIRASLDKSPVKPHPSLGEIVRADADTRVRLSAYIKNMKKE